MVIGRCGCISQVRAGAGLVRGWPGAELCFLMLNSACSWCEEGTNWNAKGAKTGWGWRRREWPGTRSCPGQMVDGGDWFWQDEVLGIYWCLGSGAAEGHRVTEAAQSSCSRPFNTWLCNQGMLLLHMRCSFGDLSVLLGRRGHLQQRGFIRTQDV